MKKNLVLWLALSFAVMILLPLLMILFVDSKDAMPLIYGLFFGLNPVFSAIGGYSAGKNIRQLWWIPLMISEFFLVGAWGFFAMGELMFVVYAVFYLLIGLIAMAMMHFFIKAKRRKK